MEGFCLLVPRNIHVSASDNFISSFDNSLLLFDFISIFLLIVTWKILASYGPNKRSITSIVFSVYKIAMNLGAAGLDQLTREENILIYTFIFGSFFLATFYETICVTFMLTDSTMRSAFSIKELNATNTKFHTYFDRKTIEKADLQSIREELVLNEINILNPAYLQIPDNLDVNLVYTLQCQYTDYFLKSSQNYKNSQQLFDKIILRQNYQNFLINKGFFYKDEFISMIEALVESGIYQFWQKEAIRESSIELSPMISLQKDINRIEFENMALPVVVVLIGCLVALVSFLVELIIFKFHHRVKIEASKIGNHIRKKIKLTKWTRKYIYNENLKEKFLSFKINQVKCSQMISIRYIKTYRKSCLKSFASYIYTRDILRSKNEETLNGSFFLSKKYRKCMVDPNFQNTSPRTSRVIKTPRIKKLTTNFKNLFKNKRQVHPNITHKIIQVGPWRTEN
ncbi:unnamed protein product [Chironomus riparius]|uniref:Ionotropic receptor n=1 Tax=Chironomus riparius TaxID=315576 RepID=A0A9N9WV43_9DIPT|nr:unnamed protein product [Chironomus riparius]